jgi:hypothetical protein
MNATERNESSIPKTSKRPPGYAIAVVCGLLVLLAIEFGISESRRSIKVRSIRRIYATEEEKLRIRDFTITSFKGPSGASLTNLIPGKYIIKGYYLFPVGWPTAPLSKREGIYLARGGSSVIYNWSETEPCWDWADRKYSIQGRKFKSVIAVNIAPSGFPKGVNYLAADPNTKFMKWVTDEDTDDPSFAVREDSVPGEFGHIGGLYVRKSFSSHYATDTNSIEGRLLIIFYSSELGVKEVFQIE